MAQQKQISQQKNISQLEFTTYLSRNTDLNLSMTEFLTLICMSSFAPLCTATQATLSARTRIKPTALKKAIAGLKSKGMIVLAEPSQRNVSCKYAFNLQRLGFPAGCRLKNAPLIDTNTAQRKKSAGERKEQQLGLALADMGISKISVGTKPIEPTERDVTPPNQLEVVTAPKTTENSDLSAIFPELDIPQNGAKSSSANYDVLSDYMPSFNT